MDIAVWPNCVLGMRLATLGKEKICGCLFAVEADVMFARSDSRYDKICHLRSRSLSP